MRVKLVKSYNVLFSLFPKVDSTKRVRKLRSLRISIVFLKIRYKHKSEILLVERIKIAKNMLGLHYIRGAPKIIENLLSTEAKIEVLIHHVMPF